MSAAAVSEIVPRILESRPPLFLLRANSSFGQLDESDVEHLEDELLLAADVARMLRVHVKKVYELSIPQVRLSPRRVRFLKADVSAYVRRQRTGR